MTASAGWLCPAMARVFFFAKKKLENHTYDNDLFIIYKVIRKIAWKMGACCETTSQTSIQDKDADCVFKSFV